MVQRRFVSPPTWTTTGMARRPRLRSRGERFQVKKVRLTNSSRVALVDDRDFNKVKLLRWRLHTPKKTYSPYVVSGGGKCCIALHQFLLPSANQVDHQDGDGLNNQRWNLRACSGRQNQANRRKLKVKTSAFKGVHWCKRIGRWVTQIKANGIRLTIGSFEYEQEAAIAYNIAAKQLFGKFARINQIKGL